jgi:hypothetical protein
MEQHVKSDAILVAGGMVVIACALALLWVGASL